MESSCRIVLQGYGNDVLNASVAQVLPCYRTLADLEQQLTAQG
jgi:hypothetical protein